MTQQLNKSLSRVSGKGASGPALACGQSLPVLAGPGLKRGNVQKAKGLGKNLQTLTEQAATSLGKCWEK